MTYKTTFAQFLENHEAQLKQSNVPQHFYKTLHEKLEQLRYDAGISFRLLQIDYEDETRGPFDPVWRLEVVSEDGISCNDPQHIYLIDHAWTFKVEHAKENLLEMETLRERMAMIMGFEYTNDKEEMTEKIFKEMWRYCNHYAVRNYDEGPENEIPVWYMMDEVGSAIGHSDEPNFRLVPFVHLNDGVTYSLLFPIKDCVKGDIVSRDFVETISKNLANTRAAVLLSWGDTSLLDKSFYHIEVDPDYFFNGHVAETLPILARFANPRPTTEKYLVYTQYDVLKKNLTDPKFEFTENEKDADILWLTRHFRNFEELSETPEKFVNQFPFEYVITIKDLLAITCRRCLKNELDTPEALEQPEWLPCTYNLMTEVAEFINYFRYLEKQGLDNYWIVKPFNLARGLQIQITNNLNHIIKLMPTGPKIAQKYITNPVLFLRPECNGKVKFDIRYVILLKSVKPLKVYIYRNFFLRFANKVFELNNFEDYEKHFTVMNYNEKAQLKHIKCSEFKELWVGQYPNYEWNDVEGKIFGMLKKVFQCATMEHPPCGISESPQSRSVYAADLMLEWTADDNIQPKLLEINWIPDCERACNYYPMFYNDIFNLLFLDKENSESFVAL